MRCLDWPSKISAKLANICKGAPQKPSDLVKLLNGNMIIKGKTLYKGMALPVLPSAGTTSSRCTSKTQQAA